MAASGLLLTCFLLTLNTIQVSNTSHRPIYPDQASNVQAACALPQGSCECCPAVRMCVHVSVCVRASAQLYCGMYVEITLIATLGLVFHLVNLVTGFPRLIGS